MKTSGWYFNSDGPTATTGDAWYADSWPMGTWGDISGPYDTEQEAALERDALQATYDALPDHRPDLVVTG